MLTRLVPQSAGQIRFAGQDLTALSARGLKPFRRRIQIVFQNPYASLNPRFTVGQILMEPLRIHQIGGSDAEREALALQQTIAALYELITQRDCCPLACGCARICPGNSRMAVIDGRARVETERLGELLAARVARVACGA
jgi:ABC-type glutathione transport system ATPase component